MVTSLMLRTPSNTAPSTISPELAPPVQRVLSASLLRESHVDLFVLHLSSSETRMSINYWIAIVSTESMLRRSWTRCLFSTASENICSRMFFLYHDTRPSASICQTISFLEEYCLANNKSISPRNRSTKRTWELWNDMDC